MKRLISVMLAGLLMIMSTVSVFAEDDSIDAQDTTADTVDSVEQVAEEPEEEKAIIKFSDVPENAEYAQAVYNLVSKGIITGFSDGTFRPNDKIQRDQFLKMVITAMGIEIEPTKQPYWAANYIRFAQWNNLISYDVIYKLNIYKEEVARILVNSIKDGVYPDNYIMFQSMIKDFDKIDSEYKEYVLKAFVSGMMQLKSDGTFGSDDYVTRAEAAVYVNRIIDVSKRTIAKMPKQTGKEKFIIPDLRVTYVDQAGYPYYFAIEIENFEEYEGKNYVATVECINHPELNKREQVWLNQWFTTEGVRNPLDGRKEPIHKQFHVWYLNRDYMKFDYVPGMELRFKVNLTNGKETRSYYVVGNIYKREPWKKVIEVMGEGY